MGTTTERLAFILSLNADGAVKAFGDVGKAADRELKRADERLDRLGSQMTKFGAGAMAFGATSLVALGGLAHASEDAHLQALKLDNTLANQPQLAGSSAGSFVALATAIQKKTAADGDAIVGAQALLGSFGATEQQILTLTPLVVDYARKTGKDMATAAGDVGKALGGKTKALAAAGVQVDAAAMKTDRFAAVTEALRGSVGGFAEAEGKTFEGRLSSLKNQLGDVGESAGAGAVIGIEKLIAPVVSLTGKINSLNPTLVQSAGEFATYGAATLGAVGSVSLLAGQVLKMRERFLAVGADGATAGLNNFGKAAAGLGLAGAVVGLYQMGQAMHGLEVDAQAAARATTDELVAAFEKLGQVRGTFADLGLNAEDVFRQIAEGSLGTAKRIRDGLAASGQDVSRFDAIIAEYGAAQARAAADTQATSDVVDEFGSTAASAAGSVSALGDAIDYAGLAADRTEGRMQALKAAVFDLPAAQRSVADGWDAIDEAATQSGGSTRDVESDMRRARDAAEGLEAAQVSLADAEAKLAEARRGPSARTKDDAQLKVREASIATQRAATALADAEKKVNEVRTKGTPGELAAAELDLEEARIRAKRAATDVKDAQAAYNDVLHSGDENSKAVKTAQDELARAQLQVRTATEAVADAQKAAAPQGGAHRDTTKAIADAYEAQKNNIWDTVDAMVQQGKSQQEIDAFIDASGKKLDEYANKYKLAKVDVDEFKKSLDLLAILSNDNRTAAAAGGNYAPPAAIAQGAYDAARRDIASATSSANAAEYRLTARLAAPIMIDKRVLAEALIDLNVEHN